MLVKGGAMAINYNPNLPPGDSPSDELIANKLGGLMLGDPEAFDSQPEASEGELDDFLAGINIAFADVEDEDEY
jgi:hypothetical protein